MVKVSKCIFICTRGFEYYSIHCSPIIHQPTISINQKMYLCFVCFTTHLHTSVLLQSSHPNLTAFTVCVWQLFNYDSYFIQTHQTILSLPGKSDNQSAGANQRDTCMSKFSSWRRHCKSSLGNVCWCIGKQSLKISKITVSRHVVYLCTSHLLFKWHSFPITKLQIVVSTGLLLSPSRNMLSEPQEQWFKTKIWQMLKN